MISGSISLEICYREPILQMLVAGKALEFSKIVGHRLRNEESG